MAQSERIKLADFQQDPIPHLADLRRTGQPRVITVNGRDSVVMQDARSYRALLDALEEAETVAGIRRGLQSIEDGTSMPFAEFEAQLRREFKLPPRRK